MRQALNNLQSTHNGFGHVNNENVFKVCDEPHPLLVKEMLNFCAKKDITKAFGVRKYSKFRRRPIILWDIMERDNLNGAPKIFIWKWSTDIYHGNQLLSAKIPLNFNVSYAAILGIGFSLKSRMGSVKNVHLLIAAHRKYRKICHKLCKSRGIRKMFCLDFDQ